MNPSHTVPDLSNPFPGLRCFLVEEDYLFFGRHEQIEDLLRRLRTNRLVAVVGTSGSGKSSLVRAGLLPAVLGGGMSQAGSAWEIAVMRPGGSPMAQLARALCEAGLYDVDAEDVQFHLQATLSRSRNGLVEAVRQSRAAAGSRLLLVVDQFEELFRFNRGSAAGQEESIQFVNLLLQATQQAEQPVYVVLTMRSDFLGECSQFLGLAEAVNDGEFLIPRMTRDQIQEAIEGPIRVRGAEIAPRLLFRLLNDVEDNQDQLPVLQHALMRTWDLWRRGVQDQRSTTQDPSNELSRASVPPPLDLEHYEATGGMHQALSRHADEIFDALPSDEHRTAAARLFRALTERGPDGRGIRRPTRLDRLTAIAGVEPAVVRLVLEAYRAPGVTFLMPPVSATLEDPSIIDISHESLMRVWDRLRGWVEEEAQSARIYRRLLETAALHSEKRAGLYHDPDLQIALSWRETAGPNAAWAEQYGGGFDGATRFLDQSREAAEREEKEREAARQRELERAQKFAEAQAKVARLFKRFAGSLAVGLCLAVALTIWAFTLRREATRQRAIAQEKQVEAEKARNDSERLLYGANLNLIQAAVEQDNYVAAARLLAETSEHPDRGFEWYYWQKRLHGEKRTFEGHLTNVTAIAFSPDSRQVASGDAEGTILIWDRATGEVRYSARQARGIRSVAYSPNGTQLLATTARSPRTLSDQGPSQVLILNTVTGGEPVTYQGMRYGAFSPDGRQIAAVDGRALYLLDPQHLQTTASARLTPFIDLLAQESLPQGQEQALGPWWVGYTPDGGKLLTGAGAWPAPPLRIRAWDARTGRREGPRIDRNGGIAEKSMAISPDGRVIAVAGNGWATAEIWSTGTGELIKTLEGHEGLVCSVRFSPNGQYLLTGSADLTARLWDTRTWLEVRRFGGGLEPIRAVAFSPDNRWLATGDDKGIVRIWEVEGGQNPYVAFQVVRDHHRGTQVSPDGRLAVTAHASGATIWDVLTGQTLRTLQPEPVPTDGYVYITTAEFSPDGKSILTASFRGGAVDIFDATSGARQRHFPHRGEGANNNANSVSSATFSPDGKRIVTAAFDGKVRIWDVESGTPLRVLNAYSNRAYYASFSPDGHRLVTSGDGGTQLWDADGGRRLFALGQPGKEGKMAVFSPDGRRIALALSGDSTVRVLDATNFDRYITLSGHKEGVNSLQFSADGKRILTASVDQTARLWDAETGREVMTLKGHKGGLQSARFFHDGHRIVTQGHDHTSRIWEAATEPDLEAWGREEKSQADLIQARINEQKAIESNRIKDPMAIKQWLMAAPIPYHGLDGVAALEQEQIPNEADLRPRAGQAVTTTNGNFKWTAVNQDSYALNFGALLGLASPDTYHKVAYAVTYIRTDTTRTNLHLKVGSDDQSKILLNGEEVYRSTEGRGWQPDEDTVPGIKLNPGLNTLVFKVVNGSGGWAGSVWITDADGKPVPGLTVTLDPDGKP